MKFLNRLHSDERGNIAILFGFVLILLALFTGIAVDVSRAYGVSSFVGSAIDSTALATARELQKQDMTDPQVQAFAQRHYEALLGNRPNTDTVYTVLNITVDRGNETVEIATSGIVQTYFAALTGQNTLTVSETTTVSYNTRVVELAMMLDVTGSMSGSKIDGLKLAANDLIELLIADNPLTKSNRIALAPYAAAVNLGSLSNRVTAPGNDSLDGCVVGRDGAASATEEEPAPGSWLTAVDPANPLPDLDPMSGVPANGYSCPGVEVLPLTKSKSDLLERVDDFTPGGWTAGHLGAAWGWYLVSPEWSNVYDNGAQPAPYSDEDTIKAVLLMTDGVFNTRYIGSAGDTSDQKAREICTNMKNENVVVYAVAFEAPAAAEATLRACASSATHYFSADNTTELREAFLEIAGSLTSLRLTQ